VPRFQQKGTFEKSASADLFSRTLTRIPTLYGKLAYLAELRDKSTGTYQHQGLMLSFGREQTQQCLRAAHQEIFYEWLRLTLAEKRQDLLQFLHAVPEGAATVIAHWRTYHGFAVFVPPAATIGDRELFLSEFRLLVSTFDTTP